MLKHWIVLLVAAGSQVLFDELYREANKTSEWQVSLRRELHRHPEVGLATHWTSERIAKELKGFGIAYTAGWAKDGDEGGAGIVAHIGSGREPVVLVRADMDGLPISEATGLPFASEVPGRMHACGHDVHTSVLLGAARLLKRREAGLKGTVRLMFQPGEELGLGATLMVQEGVLGKEPGSASAKTASAKVASAKVASAFSMHVMPMVPTGGFVATAGLQLAGGNHFTIVLSGVGGHAGAPAVARDPVVAAAALISGAQALSSRETFGWGPERHGLISFTQISTFGGATNAIPDGVSLKGTVRSGDPAVMMLMKARLQEMAASLDAGYHISSTVEWMGDIPRLYNDPDLSLRHSDLVRYANQGVSLPKFHFLYAMEDFAFVSDLVPSVTVALGIGSGAQLPSHITTNTSLHNPKFAADERVMPKASALFASLAISELEYRNTETRGKTQEL
ncbi:amidohydrolase [Gregarina niphandrodes]|uniref:Amidohydrolase n=1 Tax=Gregarina niphandrodes TaxID=110365 RepID=A0A023AYM2_GRENI|nr:amidohydrolase [Gregarina niphandrodes]EZG43543.1 amidohydrolase [Gregarina niphandrodes]|eukprot:XP_011133228.1 amidohydrolase [Gregarina niphandrodes]